MEIERKFLVTQAPHLRQSRSVRIEQGYLSGGEDEVRVRRKGDGFWLTVKRGAGMVRTEQEVALDREQFEALWPLTSGRRIEKDRTVMGAAAGRSSRAEPLVRYLRRWTTPAVVGRRLERLPVSPPERAPTRVRLRVSATVMPGPTSPDPAITT
jgi:hypothetical protein